MSLLQMIKLIQKVYSIIQEMEADGSLAKLQDAEKVLEEELANPGVQALIAELRALKL